MNVPSKLVGFALLVALSFGAAFGIGRAVGPIGGDGDPAPMSTHEGEHP